MDRSLRLNLSDKALKNRRGLAYGFKNRFQRTALGTHFQNEILSASGSAGIQ